MPTKVYTGTEVTVSDDGFFADPQQWVRDGLHQDAAGFLLIDLCFDSREIADVDERDFDSELLNDVRQQSS